MKKIVWAFLATLGLASHLQAIVVLDEFFGGTGVVIDNSPNRGNALTNIASIALQPDGKIIGVERRNNQETGQEENVVFRRNQNGSLDTSFGVNGKTTITIPDAYEIIIGNIFIRPNGKIVACGVTDFKGRRRENTFVQYTPSGTLDRTFGAGGISLTPTRFNNSIMPYHLQPDGKILVAGKSDIRTMLAMRYNQDGSLDTSFGTEGISNISQEGQDRALSCTTQSDGKSIIATAGHDSASVIRLTENGLRDTTFGTNGAISLDLFGGEDISCGIQSDNKIVLFTYAYRASMMRVMGYTADGVTDPSFNSIDSCELTLQDAKMVVQSDNKILITAVEKRPYRIRLLQLFPNGLPDQEWSNQGTVTTVLTTPLIPSTQRCERLRLDTTVVQNNGDIVLGGTIALTSTPQNDHSALFIRYHKLTVEETLERAAREAALRVEHEVAHWWDRLLHIDSGEQCSICMQDLATDAVDQAPCHHFFHEDCLNRWKFGGNNTCPLCRSPLNEAEPVVPQN